MNNPLVLAIVGHTNVGKTSLMRTLTRNTHFGTVSDQPSTTRHVEGARLNVNGQPLVELYDTPGLEDAISLRDYLDQCIMPNERPDGLDKLTLFLAGPEAKGQFEQEAKVIRQLLASDAGIYLIDVREPVLPKYRDELAILASCGKPLLPVFNFVASEQTRETSWRALLSRVGLHATMSFDTVFPPDKGEQRLYENLALLINHAQQPLHALIVDLQYQRTLRQQSAAAIIADTLITVAAYHQSLPANCDPKTAITALHHSIRQLEQQTLSQLLALYKFDDSDAVSADFPLLDGRFSHDLFSNEALKQMGIRLSLGVVAGAATGASIDLAVGGLSLGTATVLGALIGGTSQSVKHYGARLLGKLKGGHTLSVDDAILCLLMLRLLQLQRALDTRGHAAQQKLYLAAPQEEKWKTGQLPSALKAARAHPDWSALSPQFQRHNPQRQNKLDALMIELNSAMNSSQ